MNEIETWLAGNRDFARGLALLKRYDPKNRTIAICDKLGESTQTRPKLTRALRESAHIAAWGPSKQAPLPDAPANAEETLAHLFAKPRSYHPLPKGDDLFPSEISEAMQTRRRLANQRDQLANTLADAASDEARAAIRQELERLHEEIQTFNHVIGTFQKTGKVPNRGAARVVNAPHLTEEEKGEITKELQYNRSYLSRGKANLRKWEKNTKADPIKKRNRIRELKEQIANWEKIIEELTNKLKHEGTEEPQPAG